IGPGPGVRLARAVGVYSQERLRARARPREESGWTVDLRKSEGDSMTHTATLRRNFPTLCWLSTAPFRWFGKSRRRIWAVASVVLAMIAGPPLWWAIQLVGLPDIGEPFDVQAFRSFTIPDD